MAWAHPSLDTVGVLTNTTELSTLASLRLVGKASVSIPRWPAISAISGWVQQRNTSKSHPSTVSDPVWEASLSLWARDSVLLPRDTWVAGGGPPDTLGHHFITMGPTLLNQQIAVGPDWGKPNWGELAACLEDCGKEVWSYHSYLTDILVTVVRWEKKRKGIGKKGHTSLY